MGNNSITYLVSKPSDARARTHVRELSVDNWRELIGFVRKYAQKWFARYGLPESELEDVIVHAGDNAYERVCNCRKPIRNLKAFMRVCAYRAVATRLNRLKPPKVLENLERGDSGLGVKRIVEQIDQETDRTPDWLVLFRYVRMRQRGAAVKVLNALKKDSRHEIAREISGLGHGYFYRVIKKLQSEFDQCYQAYRALWATS